jgi:hypothetical protein
MPKRKPRPQAGDAAAKLMDAMHKAVRESMLSGITSYADIAQKLNSQGLVGPHGRPWTAKSVEKALPQRKY